MLDTVILNDYFADIDFFEGDGEVKFMQKIV